MTTTTLLIATAVYALAAIPTLLYMAKCAEQERQSAELQSRIDALTVQNKILIHQRDELLYGRDYRETPGSKKVEDYLGRRADQ